MTSRPATSLEDAYRQHGHKLADYVDHEEREKIYSQTMANVKKEIVNITKQALPDYDRAVELRELEKRLKLEFAERKKQDKTREKKVNVDTVEQAVKHLHTDMVEHWQMEMDHFKRSYRQALEDLEEAHRNQRNQLEQQMTVHHPAADNAPKPSTVILKLLKQEKELAGAMRFEEAQAINQQIREERMLEAEKHAQMLEKKRVLQLQQMKERQELDLRAMRQRFKQAEKDMKQRMSEDTTETHRRIQNKRELVRRTNTVEKRTNQKALHSTVLGLDQKQPPHAQRVQGRARNRQRGSSAGDGVDSRRGSMNSARTGTTITRGSMDGESTTSKTVSATTGLTGGMLCDLVDMNAPAPDGAMVFGGQGQRLAADHAVDAREKRRRRRRQEQKSEDSFSLDEPDTSTGTGAATLTNGIETIQQSHYEQQYTAGGEPSHNMAEMTNPWADDEEEEEEEEEEWYDGGEDAPLDYGAADASFEAGDDAGDGSASIGGDAQGGGVSNSGDAEMEAMWREMQVQERRKHQRAKNTQHRDREQGVPQQQAVEGGGANSTVDSVGGSAQDLDPWLAATTKFHDEAGESAGVRARATNVRRARPRDKGPARRPPRERDGNQKRSQNKESSKQPQQPKQSPQPRRQEQGKQRSPRVISPRSE
jgi:hypothetical protein